jgi:hypothetical protein
VGINKIGILVFSNKSSIKVGRDGRKDYSFDGLKLNGLNKIIKELNYPYEYCSTATINNYDDVLVSLTSYHDVLNLILNVPKQRRAKIHIGGPACNNINPILPYIDSANFGRCDCGKINDIIDGRVDDTVWLKKTDPYFEGVYCVDVSARKGLGENENSFGCRQKCAFCFYSWWNGYINKIDNNHYNSGLNNYEDFFQSLDWNKCIRGGVTALDGTTEKTRRLIKKPIDKNVIINTLLESNKVITDTTLRVKVYGIVGYPWEVKDELRYLDLIDCIKSTESQLKNKIIIRMHFSHFIPFQKTPMWMVKFNFNNYRNWCLSNPVLYESRKIKVYSGGTFTPSPALAATSTIIQRCKKSDTKIIETLANKKFYNLNSDIKIRIFKKELMRFFVEQNEESIPNTKNQTESN